MYGLLSDSGALWGRCLCGERTHSHRSAVSERPEPLASWSFLGLCCHTSHSGTAHVGYSAARITAATVRCGDTTVRIPALLRCVGFGASSWAVSTHSQSMASPGHGDNRSTPTRCTAASVVMPSSSCGGHHTNIPAKHMAPQHTAHIATPPHPHPPPARLERARRAAYTTAKKDPTPAERTVRRVRH